MCYDQVDFAKVVQGIKEGLQWLNISSPNRIPGDLFLSVPLMKRIKGGILRRNWLSRADRV